MGKEKPTRTLRLQAEGLEKSRTRKGNEKAPKQKNSRKIEFIHQSLKIGCPKKKKTTYLNQGKLLSCSLIFFMVDVSSKSTPPSMLILFFALQQQIQNSQQKQDQSKLAYKRVQD